MVIFHIPVNFEDFRKISLEIYINIKQVCDGKEYLMCNLSPFGR